MHFLTLTSGRGSTMATTNFTRQLANVDEAILLRSFDNLERALREQATDRPAKWAERLTRCLMDVEMALGSHQRVVEASDSPTEDQEHHGNVPATIERRWDKLRTAIQETIARVHQLRQRTESVA